MLLHGPAPGPVTSTRTHSAPAQLIPTVQGRVVDVRGGYVYLDDVQYSLLPGEARPQLPLPVPAGRWLNDTHWQADGDSLDLFRGEEVVYMIQHHFFMPSSDPTSPSLHFVHGIVTGTPGDRVELAIYDGIGGNPASWHSQTGAMTLRLAPYSHYGSPLWPGEKVVVGWFGDTSDRIIWQVTDLSG